MISWISEGECFLSVCKRSTMLRVDNLILFFFNWLLANVLYSYVLSNRCSVTRTVLFIMALVCVIRLHVGYIIVDVIALKL